jgi:hypothetical protein
MELPDDVLQLIREFSRPRFKYFREYNRARKRFQHVYFPDIKPCLLKNPLRILPILKRLEDWDEEYIRLSNDFQKRYDEYVESRVTEMKRKSLRKALCNLLLVREDIYSIALEYSL